MDRKTLESKGLTAELIEFIMSENGKDVQAEKGKTKQAVDDAIMAATAPLNNQIAELDKQNKEFQTTIQNAAGIDEKAKTEIAKIQADNKAALKKMKDEFEAETAKVKREADTKEFLSRLSRKFVTPETARAFEARINEALIDKANEGKSRADIFAALSVGDDGKERTDIYVADNGTKPPEAAGKTNPPPSKNSDPFIAGFDGS